MINIGTNAYIYRMKRLSPLYVLFLFLTPLLLPAQPSANILPDEQERTAAAKSSTGYPDIDLYYSQLEKNVADDIYARRYYLLETMPIDSLLAAYAERRHAAFNDTISLNIYFSPGLVRDNNELRAIFPQAYEKALRYDSPALMRQMERFRSRLRADVPAAVRPEPYSYEELMRCCRQAGDYHLETDILMELWASHFISHKHAGSFAYARQLEEALDRIGDDYPSKANGYLWMGTAYFKFKDYDRALPLFRKGLSLRSDRNVMHSQRYVLQAWNHLAVYHEMQGNLDSAAYYHRSILASPEGLSDSPVSLDIAICNLGRVEMAKGDYDAAIAYLQAGLKQLEQNTPGANWDFAHGVYLSLGECMLAKNDLVAAKGYIEKVRPGLDVFPEQTQAGRLKDLFALESRYYSRLGEFDKADVCLDSARYFTEKYEQLTSQNFITLGEQQLQEVETQLKNQQIARQRNIILFAIVALVLISAALLVIARLYHRRNAAYKKLAQKAQEWAMQDEVTRIPVTFISAPGDDAMSPNTDTETSGNTKEPPGEEDLRIMALADREMTENHAYREAGLTAESMADRLGVHRNSLARAISRTTGGNFSLYINGLRVKEAIRIISQTSRKELYIEELSERVGFGNRSTFSRTFKQFTGLAPLEFQKQKENKQKSDAF